jgi:hypothetical protein
MEGCSFLVQTLPFTLSYDILYLSLYASSFCCCCGCCCGCCFPVLLVLVLVVDIFPEACASALLSWLFCFYDALRCACVVNTARFGSVRTVATAATVSHIQYLLLCVCPLRLLNKFSRSLDRGPFFGRALLSNIGDHALWRGLEPVSIPRSTVPDATDSHYMVFSCPMSEY